MPVFEYRCADCQEKYEVLVKNLAAEKDVTCPRCASVNKKKLLSKFSAKAAPSAQGGCADGSCNIPQGGGCCGGHCAHN